MNRVILHVGAGKAGSSAIQSLLLSNREHLARHGLYYPRHGQDENQISGGHSALGTLLREQDGDGARRQFLAWRDEALGRACDLVLSAESLIAIPEAVHAMLPDDAQYRIIAYFRDPIDVLVSSHNQLVKRHFYAGTLADYLEIIIARPPGIITGRVLGDWMARFGADNVEVYPYDRRAFRDGRIEHDILDVLGLDAAARAEMVFPERDINASYTRPALEMKRLLNMVLSPNDIELQEALDRGLQRQSDRARAAGPVAQEPISRPQLDRLRAALDDDLQVMRGRILRRCPAGFLDLARHESRGTDSPEAVTAAELRAVWQGLVREKKGLRTAVGSALRRRNVRPGDRSELGRLAGIVRLPWHTRLAVLLGAGRRRPPHGSHISVQLVSGHAASAAARDLHWQLRQPRDGMPLEGSGHRIRLKGWIQARTDEPLRVYLDGPDGPLPLTLDQRHPRVVEALEKRGECFPWTAERCGFDIWQSARSTLTLCAEIGNRRHRLATLFIHHAARHR